MKCLVFKIITVFIACCFLSLGSEVLADDSGYTSCLSASKYLMRMQNKQASLAYMAQDKQEIVLLKDQLVAQIRKEKIRKKSHSRLTDEKYAQRLESRLADFVKDSVPGVSGSGYATPKPAYMHMIQPESRFQKDRAE